MWSVHTTLRPLSETHPLGGTSTGRLLTRSYDNLSRPDGFGLGTPADPDLDHSASYGFDVAGRYDNVTGAGKSFGYTYTAGNLIDTVTGPVHTVTNTWDKPRRTIYSKNNEVASSTVSQYTYGVNHIGQRETVQTAGSAFGNTDRGWAWGYDPLGQATKAVNAADTALNRAYAFDGIGNRTSATEGSGGSATTIGYTPNASNQYEAINPGTAVNPTYDADGNLLTDAGINALTYGLKYEWDAENRLIAVRKADDTLLVTYTYDYLSRRIRKTTTAAAYSVGATDTAYLYDGWNVVAEYSISGGSTVALVQAYTWGIDLSGSMQGAGGVGGLLSIHRSPGTDGNSDRTWTDTFYPTYDGNGNVSEYLDKNGDDVAHFEYDPFGRLAASTGTPANFTYRFSTKPQDFETGLYYYGYRYYDPITGRWPSRDPIGERGGINLYGFVGNDGVNFWDRLGWDPQGPTMDANGRSHAPTGTSRGGQFVTPPSNNLTPSNSLDPSRGIQGGGPNSPSERGSSSATGGGDAVAGAAVWIADLARSGADRSARGLAITECAKLLSGSACTGFRCNSCDVSYRRDFNPDGTPLARVFALAVARPCQRCSEPRSPGYYASGGPGFPPRMQKKYPASGRNSAIYVNIPDESFFKWLFNSDQFSFTVENECIAF